MIHKSLTFWTLLVGLIAFVLRWYFPEFPLDHGQILALVLFALGLIGIYPTLHARGARALASPPVVNSLAFWQLVAGFITFVILFFAPDFPFGTETILAVILFVLGYVGIRPELRERGLIGESGQPGPDGYADPAPAAAPAVVLPIAWSKVGLVLMLWAIFYPLGSIGLILFLIGAVLYIFA